MNSTSNLCLLNINCDHKVKTSIGLSGRKLNLKNLQGTSAQMYMKTNAWYCLRQKYAAITKLK